MRNWVLLFSILFHSSCSDFLTVQDINQLSQEQVFTDIENVNTAVIGLYNELVTNTRMYDEFYILYPELLGGNMKPNPEEDVTVAGVARYLSLYQFIARADDEEMVSNVYRDHYRLIQAADQIIRQTPLLEGVSLSRVEAYVAEAKVIRALLYFQLAQLYGQDYQFQDQASHLAIPIVTDRSETFAERQRNTVMEIYNLVIEDLTTALQGLNGETVRSSPSTQWITKEVGWALLSRVYLYQGDYERCLQAADSVLSETNRMLPQYESHFSSWASGVIEDGLWVLRADFVQSEGINSAIGALNQSNIAEYTISEDLLSLFEVDDLRQSQLIGETQFRTLGTFKYPWQANTKSPKPVIRLAEVYLNQAESYAALNQYELARDAVERVRAMSLRDFSLDHVANEDLLSFIYDERRRELAFEGHLFFDLRRWQLGVERSDYPSSFLNANVSYPSNTFVLPLPQNAIIQNPSLIQNPGY